MASIFDKIKSKLKSAEPEELLSSVPAIRTESKAFQKDAVDLAKICLKAMNEHTEQLGKLRTGGAADFATNRRDFELAVGQMSRLLETEMKAWGGKFAAFILNMQDLREQLEKAAKKATDARLTTRLKDAVRALVVEESDCAKMMNASHNKYMQEQVKAAPSNIQKAQAKFKVELNKVESLCGVVESEGKWSADHVRTATKKLDEVKKAAGKRDLKKVEGLLKEMLQIQGKQAALVGNNKTHQKTMEKLGADTSLGGNAGSADLLFPPRLKKDFEAVNRQIPADAAQLKKLLEAGATELKALKSARV